MNKILLSFITLGIFISVSFKCNDPISSCKVVKIYNKSMSTTTKSDGSFDTKISHIFRRYGYNPNGSLNTITDSSSVSQKNRIKKFIYNSSGHLEAIKGLNDIDRNKYIDCDRKGNIIKISTNGMHSSFYTNFIYENEKLIQTQAYNVGQSGEYLMNKITYTWSGDNIVSSIDSIYIHGDTLYTIKTIEFLGYQSSINPDYLLYKKIGVNPLEESAFSKNNYESYYGTSKDYYVAKGKVYKTRTISFDLTNDENNKLTGSQSHEKDRRGEYLNNKSIEYECK